MGALKKLFLFIPSRIKRFFSFLKEVKSEMKKVKWPTFKELRGYTTVVLVISLIVLAYFMGLDYIIERIKSIFG
ncbi:preprotein translocase subunit SecE [Priestia megaterium]|nr:preprotein translocase subunit SecE [Priestia megaterium]